MKNIYFFLKLNRHIKSVRLKNLGIYLLHIFGKRYLGLFIDPVCACNLRCRMCYFSDDERRKELLSKPFRKEDLPLLANAFFHRALKLQIGCGAEPSLFAYNTELIRLAKEKKVPYISMTTNANLFNANEWRELVKTGLNEVTLSVHGVRKETYEYFMQGASYEKFCKSLQILSELKQEYPGFKVRINYTVNQDNLEELVDFFDVFGTYRLDILQIRPIQQLGNTAYDNFSWEKIYDQYDAVIGKLKAECRQRQITCMTPDRYDLIKTDNSGSAVTDSTYIYISPRNCWQADFDLQNDTFETYSAKHHIGRQLFLKIFQSKQTAAKSKNKLNYEIN
ncbi:hypothetical protein AGMMS50262_05260 [Bacteroidia bacterium]|nr:hypothetical protein AGMMS50262_05260 [Bacteroidia bacterium]